MDSGHGVSFLRQIVPNHPDRGSVIKQVFVESAVPYTLHQLPLYTSKSCLGYCRDGATCLSFSGGDVLLPKPIIFRCIYFHLKVVVRPKHVADNLNKIVNNYWNRVALDGNPWTWSIELVNYFPTLCFQYTTNSSSSILLSSHYFSIRS
jgi:hypothetical protein